MATKVTISGFGESAYNRVVLADFAAPKKGARISVERSDGRPAPQYYYVDQVEKNGPLWNASVIGQSGNREYLGSDQVRSWQHYSGPLYEWDERRKQERQQREQEESLRREEEARRSAFEGVARFPQGRVLRKGMILKVKEGAPDPLDIFAGERLRVEEVDEGGMTARLGLVGDISPDLASLGSPGEISSLLASPVPVGVVVEWTEPASPEKGRAVYIWEPSGEKSRKVRTIEESEMPGEFPALVRAIQNGKIRLAGLNVYENYGEHRSGKGRGMEVFARDMASRGVNPESLPYTVNPAEDIGGRLRGAWQATMRVSGPVDDELRAEIQKAAPNSQVKWMRNGDVVVHSNSLLTLMVSLGAFDREPAMATQASLWALRTCHFG